MRRSSYVILSYKVKHNYDVSDFLGSYRYLLQKGIDVIWGKIEWKRKGKRLIPLIPKSKKFRRGLRNCLLQNWNYASHYVDSAIKTAYSILSSWRRNYLKGRRSRNKPIVRREFARVKETLYRFRDWRISITVKPYQLYLDFDLSNAWFRERVEGCDLGELILKENELIVTFRVNGNNKTTRKIAWDMNLLSMDGFCDKGWIKVDLKPLYTLHITYENLRRKIQKLEKRKPKTAKRLREKYSRRYRNRIKDFLHKLTTEITEEFKDYEHGFEDLEKQRMFNRRRTHNRVISKQNWKQIIALMSYKANVKLLNPRNSTITCPRCGGRMKHRKGQVLCGKCSLKIDRQLNASINLYLRMWGFPPSPSTFFRAVIKKMIRSKRVQMRGGSGVALKGCETNDMLPMNPEGVEVDVHQGLRRSIKTYVG